MHWVCFLVLASILQGPRIFKVNVTQETQLPDVAMLIAQEFVCVSILKRGGCTSAEFAKEKYTWSGSNRRGEGPWANGCQEELRAKMEDGRPTGQSYK